MNLFGFDAPYQPGLCFPMPLTEKYRPTRIGEFAGLDKVKRILGKFAANPRPMNFRFIGPSGTGKTTMALALASEIAAEVHHIPSQVCNLATLQRVCETCAYVPMAGRKWHVCLVDEADQMSNAAQLYLLSKLDSTGSLPNTIWIFTCNEEDRLEPRFLSRTLKVEFSSYGIASDATELLQRVWASEVGASEHVPNFARLVKEESNNIRGALMRLETEILAA